MARTPYALNSYVGGATPNAVISGTITAVATSITVTGTDATWGTLGSNGGFFAALNYGIVNEEKVYVPSGSYSWSSGVLTLTNVVRGVDNTTASGFTGVTFIAPVLTSTDLIEANELVSQNLGNFTVRSATATLLPGEWTVFSGTTAGQTLSLPVAPINQTDNEISNYSTVAVTVASGSTAQMNTYGILGNTVINPNDSYTYTYQNANNTWYTTGTTSNIATRGSGIAGQVLTPSGAGLIVWENPSFYAMPATYLSPYKAWTIDPALASTSIAMISGTAIYEAIWIPTAMTLSGISFYVATWAATSTVYLALFNNTTQLATCSGLIGGTTGFRTALISGGTYSITSPGLYYVGLVNSGSSGCTIAIPTVLAGAQANMGITASNNTLANTRCSTIAIGNRAFYATGGVVSGTPVLSGDLPFFALS